MLQGVLRRKIGGFHFAFAWSENGICYLDVSLHKEVSKSELFAKVEVNDAVESPECQKLIKELEEYLQGGRTQFTVNLDLTGTDFQKKVWSALAGVSYGETRCYKDIARMIGHEKSARAVGQALRANPVPILVPCHRVICASGGLGGFSSGLTLKKKLLALERRNCNLSENA